MDRHPRAAQRPTRRCTHHVVAIQVGQQWRMGLQGVRRQPVVPLETCADRSGGSGGGSARAGRRPASLARFCRRRAGDVRVADQPPSAEPAPSSPAPALSTAIAPPPPLLPPPPPPTSAQQITPPAPTRGYTPRRSAPPQSDMPEIGVTRTPVTRAPMSATPPPPPSPDRNSSKPGDAPKGGWGPW
ncbi:MAG: hypothetical protein QOI25_4265 [Mycobacterium sp.]|nr:hypothetical protein [Mycobacterium sp.]